MKKSTGRLVSVVVAIVVLLVVGVGIALLMVDTLARRGVARGASYALAVPVSLNSADVGVMSGQFEMSGLEVENPEGFDAPHFLMLNSGGVTVSLGTLLNQTVNLPRLDLAGMDVHLVRSGGKSNYGVILENLKRFESGEKKEPSKGAGKTFVIDRVQLTDISVHVKALPVGGEATTLDVAIPEIVLTDVGAGERGPVRLTTLASAIVKAVLQSTAQVGSGLPDAIRSELQGGLGQLSSLQEMGVGAVEQAGARIEEVGEQIQGAADEAKQKADDVKKQAEEAAKDIKGIFGGGGEKKPEEKKEEGEGGG